MAIYNNTVIIIAGPTASGKTALAIQLVKHFNTSIISADSRQCYKELNIGVAKPTTKELAEIQHYFISSHSIYEDVNAAVFENYALQKADEIFKQSNIAVMVGGTGLYIDVFCKGMDAIPAVPSEVRDEIINQYKQNGLHWLQNAVQQKDPLFWQTAEQQNPQRLMRALEIINYTGASITSFKNQKQASRPFNIIKIGIALSKEQLHNNINTRTDNMMQQGLLQEVEKFVPLQHLNALQTVGYKELFAYLKDKSTLEEAIEQIKIHTRQYAKRQLTWFRKDAEVTWFHPENVAAIINHIKICLT